MGAFGGLAEEGQDPNYWVYRSPCWRPDCVAGKGVDCGEAERGGGGLEEGYSTISAFCTNFSCELLTNCLLKKDKNCATIKA